MTIVRMITMFDFDFFDWGTSSEPAADISMIDSLRLKAKEWAQKVVDVYNTPVTGPLAEEKKRLLSKAKWIKDTIEGVLGTVDELEGAGLGILPLIPVAVIGAAAAAIYKWTLDYKTFTDKVAAQKDLIAKGASPMQAAQMVAKLDEGTSLINLKGLLPVVLIGGGLWWFSQNKRKG